jgi:hypothetical protein
LKRDLFCLLSRMYTHRYRSTVARHYPTLNVHDERGNITAAAGLRMGVERRPFPEASLRRPAEAVPRDRIRHPIGWDQIIEICNPPALTRLNRKQQDRLHALCTGKRRPPLLHTIRPKPSSPRLTTPRARPASSGRSAASAMYSICRSHRGLPEWGGGATRSPTVRKRADHQCSPDRDYRV